MQVFEVEDMSFKLKEEDDRESYAMLTRGRRGSENLTPALGEVRSDTYVLPNLTELENVVNAAHNIINEGNAINENNRKSLSRITPKIFIPPKAKDIDLKPLSHKWTSSNAYDMWDDLARLNANISVAQLIDHQSLKKQFKEV